MRFIHATLLLSALLPAATRALEAQRAIPNGTIRSGSLSFDGRATTGDFTGTTSTMTGAITGGRDLSAVRGWVEAPVNTLFTGTASGTRISTNRWRAGSTLRSGSISPE